MAVTQKEEMRVNEHEQFTDPTHSARHEEHEHGHEQAFELAEVLRVVFVALAATAVWFHLWEPFHRVSVIGLAAALIGGFPIFKEAFENIIERRMTMELSMAIALISALAIGEFFTALVITAFVLGAEILEGLTVGRGRRAIQDMLDFLPQIASVMREGQIVDVTTQTILPEKLSLFDPAAGFPSMGRLSVDTRSLSRLRLRASRCQAKRWPGAKCTPAPSTRPAAFRFARTGWEKKLLSARSLKQSKRPNTHARQSRRWQIGSPDIWSISL
jgi:hypothetical protein